MFVRSKHSAHICYSGPDHRLRRTEVHSHAVVSSVRRAIPSPDLRQVHIHVTSEKNLEKRVKSGAVF